MFNTISLSMLYVFSLFCWIIVFMLNGIAGVPVAFLDQTAKWTSIWPTLQVKVFAWLPCGDQFFWFRETFLQIKSAASKF